eukprot:1160657-Pelagomonas_calceolata.AAC.1
MLKREGALTWSVKCCQTGYSGLTQCGKKSTVAEREHDTVQQLRVKMQFQEIKRRKAQSLDDSPQFTILTIVSRFVDTTIQSDSRNGLL